jgi:Na+:H+ antiporter
VEAAAVLLHVGDLRGVPVPVTLFLYGAANVVVLSFVPAALFSDERERSRPKPAPSSLATWLTRVARSFPLRAVASVIGILWLSVAILGGLLGPHEAGRNVLEQLSLALPWTVLLPLAGVFADPVTALLHRLGMPDRLLNLFEAESLANDGTGVVVFTVVLGVAATGTFAPASIALDFIRLAGGGVLAGLAVGFGLSLITTRIDDVRVELSLTAVAAYGGYLLGDLLHVSGILVVVVAAIVLGNVGRPHGMSEQTQQAVDIFWDYVAFVLNTSVFVLIGLAVPLRQLLADPAAILSGIVVAVVARAAAVYVLLPPFAPFRQRIPLRWQHLLVWGGLRGAVATALALSLLGRGDGYEQVLGLAYGVVLTSILVQGVTIGPVARLLLRERVPARV